MSVTFELDGQTFILFNGGPMFKINDLDTEKAKRAMEAMLRMKKIIQDAP